MNSAEIMSRCVLDFNETNDYNQQHEIIKTMAQLPDRDHIEVNLGFINQIKFRIRVTSFAFKHERNDVDCSCMDD